MTSPGHRSVGVSVEVEAFRRADVSAHDALQSTCPALRDRHLIARGHRGLSYAMLMIYVIPLMTYGVWWLWRCKSRPNSAPLVSSEA